MRSWMEVVAVVLVSLGDITWIAEDTGAYWEIEILDAVSSRILLSSSF